MKKTLLFLSLCIALILTSQTTKAQNLSSDYRTAIGAKGYFGNGSLAGINIKHFLKGNSALEGSLLFRSGFFALEGMYEWHGNISGANGLQWYVGPGGLLGFYNSKGTGGGNSTLFA